MGTEELSNILQTDTKPVKEVPEADKMAASQDPQTESALAVLSTPTNFFSGANSAPNAPFQNQGPKNPADDKAPDIRDKDYSTKFGATLGQLAMLKGFAGSGSVMAPFVAAAVPALTGGGDWAAARSNADATTPTQAPQQPTTGQRFVSGLNGALSDLGAAVEPLDTAGNRPGGALAGAARVAGAQQTRTANEQRDRIATATANAQMLHEQALIHKMGEDAIAPAIESGKQGLALMMTAHVPGQKIADGVNSDQLNQMIEKGQIDPSYDTVFLTGRTVTGKDANGLPMFRSTYTVVKPGGPIQLDEKTADYLNSRLGTNYGGGHKNEKGEWESDGLVLPAAILNQQWQRAQIVDANTAAANKAAYEAGITDRKIAVNSDASKLLQSDKLAQMTSHFSTPQKDGSQDPFADIKTFYALQRNPELIKEMGVDPRTFRAAYAQAIYGEGNEAKWETHLEKYDEEFQKSQDRSKVAIGDDKFTVEHPTEALALTNNRIQAIADEKAQLIKQTTSPTASDNDKIIAQAKITELEDEAKAAVRTRDLAKQTMAEKNTEAGLKAGAETQARLKAEEGDFDKLGDSSLSGEAYLNSLPEGTRGVLKAIAEGREVRSARQLQDKNGNPSALAQALHRAYPDFDIEKATKYGDLRKNFTTGRNAIDLDHGGTALMHLNELQLLNTWDSRRPGSAAQKAYDNKLNTVVHELMNFYHMPATNDSVESLKSGMGGWVNRDAAILSQAQSMADRFNSIHQEWENGQPRPSYTPPMPGISIDAKKAMARLMPDFVKDHSDWQIEPEQTNPTQTPVANPKPAAQGHQTNQQEHVSANKAVGYATNDTYQANGWNWVVDKVNADGTIAAAHATTKVQ